MPNSPDLMLAILAMDSYNRGYGAGISDAGENDPDGLGESSEIGTASIITPLSVGRTKQVLDDWKDTGFYAVAYEVKAGAWEGLEKDTTVISYRGTDDFAPQYV